MPVPATSPTTEYETYGVADAANAPFDPTDAAVAINQWIRDAQTKGQSVVRLLPGKYKIASPIRLRDGVVLEGSGRDVTTIELAGRLDDLWTHNDAIIVDPSPFLATDPGAGLLGANDLGDLPAARLVTVAPRADRLHVPPLEAPHVVFPQENPIVDGFHVLHSYEPFAAFQNPERLRGEIVRVFGWEHPEASPDMGALVIEGMTRDRYGETGSVFLAPIRFARGCGARRLAVTQRRFATSPISRGAAIRLRWVRRGIVDDCWIHGIAASGVVVQSCIDTTVTSCMIEDLVDDGASGYGIILSNACERVVVQGNTLRRARHGIEASAISADGAPPTELSGVPRGTVVSKNVVSQCTNAGISWHAHAAGVTVANNVVFDCLGFGIYCRGTSATIQGNIIDWCGAGIGVEADGPEEKGRLMGAGTQVVGNVIRHIQSFPRREWPARTAGAVASAEGGGGTGIELRATDHVTVSGNTVSDCWGIGIHLRRRTRRCVIADNVLVDVGQREPDNRFGDTSAFPDLAAIELERQADGLPVGVQVDQSVRSNVIEGNIIFSTSPEGERWAGPGRADWGIWNRGDFNVDNVIVKNVAANMARGTPYASDSPYTSTTPFGFEFDN